MAEFRKCFFEFNDNYNLVLITQLPQVNFINIKTHSSKPNKLRNIDTLGRRGSLVCVLFVVTSWISQWHILFGVTLTLTLTSGLSSRNTVSEEYLLYYLGGESESQSCYLNTLMVPQSVIYCFQGFNISVYHVR